MDSEEIRRRALEDAKVQAEIRLSWMQQDKFLEKQRDQAIHDEHVRLDREREQRERERGQREREDREREEKERLASLMEGRAQKMLQEAAEQRRFKEGALGRGEPVLERAPEPKTFSERLARQAAELESELRERERHGREEERHEPHTHEELKGDEYFDREGPGRRIQPWEQPEPRAPLILANGSPESAQCSGSCHLGQSKGRAARRPRRGTRGLRTGSRRPGGAALVAVYAARCSSSW